MADITVRNLRELLEAQVGEGDVLRLAGDRWSLNHVLCDLYTLPPDYQFPPATDLLRRAGLARAAAPFDWLAAVCGRDEEARPVLAEATRREDGPEARSVFLPVLLEILAYTAASGLLDQAAVERLHAHLECTWSVMEREHRLLYAGSRLVMKGCAVYPAAGCAEAGMNLLRAIRALVANRVLIDRPDDLSLHATNATLASALCALIWEHLESDQLLTPGERVVALASNDELAPRGALRELEAATGAWREAGERQGWPGRWHEAFRRAELDCRYLRLGYDFAQAEVDGGWPAFPYEEFERLADEYRAAGLPAARVLCSAIGHIAFRLRRRPDDLARFRGAIGRLAARLDGAMSQVPPGHPDFLASAARLVECYAVLDEPARCRPWVAKAIETLVEALPVITDPYTRSCFLRDADDWLGYAHVSSAGESDGPERFFERAYQRLRGRTWSMRERPTEASLLQVCASRPCIAIRASYGDGGLEAGVRLTQECFIDLQSISDQARRDCRHFHETGSRPDSEGRWAELAGRLAGQLRLGNLLREIAEMGAHAGHPILVETHGNGLHVPWCGLLAESIARPDAVLVSDLDIDPTCASAAAGGGDCVLALNCFTVDDSLDASFIQLAGRVGATHVRCADRASFRAGLEAHPARLILTGGHGIQRGILQKLSLQIGDGTEDARDVWTGVRLPRAAVVVGFTCYGGGGESQATGEFGSIASLALRSGARAAVASRWPAWMLPETIGHYRELLTALAASTLDPDTWRLAADVMRFVRAMRGAGLWNALGWGVYTPGR